MERSKVRLERGFFGQSTLVVARRLLGKRLVRELDGVRCSGRIVETEAYIGQSDLACHARAGKTPRTGVMFGPPGFSYVYFTYGIHWLLNVVTEREGFAAAVLIRAIEPLEGMEQMSERRGRHFRPVQWTNGPAKLTLALGIAGKENGLDLCDRAAPLWIEEDQPMRPAMIARSPRIGIAATPEPWRSKPWRFFLRENEFVSRSRP